MSTQRLGPGFGTRIHRGRSVTLQFDGRSYPAFEGDTITSALLANGVRLLSRSFKYHRPRGTYSAAAQEANSLVQVGNEPSVRADTTAVPNGQMVRAQNVVGSLENDWLSLLELLSPFLPVGFYYKAFYKPKGVWTYWEKLIRAMAGLGRIDTKAAHHGYADKQYLFADVAVVGGGAAGMSAALEAAAAGAEVVLIEAEPALGGALEYARFDVEGGRGRAQLEALRPRVESDARITVLTGATCTGWFADNWLAVMQGQRLHKLRARSVVIATGVIEQPLVCRNNDLPGVMFGSAAQRLIRLYGVRPGDNAVVATANDAGYAVTLDLIEAGVKVAAVVDLRPGPQGGTFESAVTARGIRIQYGHTVYEVVPGPGKRSIAGVVVDVIAGEGLVAGRPQHIDCDLLCTSVGYTPAGHLVCHSGGQLAYDESLAMLVIDRLPGDTAVAAGAVNGCFDLDAAVAEGRHAGTTAATLAGLSATIAPPPTPRASAVGQNHPWPIFPHPKGKDFIDFDEDLQTRDIVNAVADGYDDLDLVKRYSTVVMGPSQGRHSALNNLRLATRAAGRPLGGATVTTQRPPFVPELLEVLGGRGFQPTRLTAMHHQHLALGAQMMPAGVWLRPAYYGDEAGRSRHIETEVRAVREGVGLIDVSTLGKLEIRGPDAAEFLNRLYTFAYVKQPIGRSRYVLLTDGTGAIADDGVACRLNAEHFYVTATTSGVDAVYRSMMRWNAEWRLNVDIANVTAAYAAVNLAGPKSREILRSLTDLDLNNEAFPYMGVREATIAGVPARLLRVGFVGELGYEIHVPASQGEYLWEKLMTAGAAHGIRAFGVEAQRVLRLEKGHIIIGQDTDGLTFPQEAEMGWAIAQSKPFFVGKRAIDVQASRPLTRRLVGFTLPGDATLPEECNLTVRNGDIIGRVTSAVRSPTLGRIVGLAYVAPDQTAPGARVDIKLSNGTLLQAEVATVPFYDPDNQRQEI